MSLTELISKLDSGKDLYKEEAHDAMVQLLKKASDSKIRSFLLAMNNKKVTSDELIGFARAMRENARMISPAVLDLVDTCGTGGDHKNTVNISTGAAIVAAASGTYVAKHGNYSVSSNSGSANVMEKFGYNLNLSPDQSRAMIEEMGFGFLFAPTFHPAMKRVAKVRKELGRTIFNLVGPLSNPADAASQLLGVYDPQLCPAFRKALRELHVNRAMVVHSQGLDEISNLGETIVYELDSYTTKHQRLKPSRPCTLEDLHVSSPEESASKIKDVLAGRRGPIRDAIVRNAAAAIYLGTDPRISMERAVSRAEATIDTGVAARKLDRIVEYSRSF